MLVHARADRDIRRSRPFSQGWRAPVLSAALSALLLTLPVWTAPQPAAAQATCEPTIVGVDTSLANGQNALSLGDAIGQTFVAPETTITSITVWRPAPSDTIYAGLHLFLLSADSLGHPNVSNILLDGPTVYNFYSDGVHPVPYKFSFNPPIVLPSPGNYHFAIQTVPCNGFFFFSLNSANAYPNGGTWWYNQNMFTACHLRPNPEDNGPVDLVFEVEFCGPTTAVLRPSWGRIKATYR
jgi:hypothetical protein